MRTFTQFLFPSKKASNSNVSCPGLIFTFILITIITISFFAPSHAQQIIFNDNYGFYPLIFMMNYSNPSDYLINLNYNYRIPPYLQNIYDFPVFYPFRYLVPESLFLSNSWSLSTSSFFILR